MIDLPKATKKAKEYLKDVGYSEVFLELDEAKKKDNKWNIKYDYTKMLNNIKSVEVKLDEQGSVIGFDREREEAIIV